MWVFHGRQSPGPGWWSAAGIALTAYLIIALLVITFGGSWAVRNVLRPLSNTSIVADRVAQGDLTVSVASVGTRRGDELTYAVRAMLQELRTLVRAIRTSADSRDIAWDLIRAAFASVAERAIVPLQDVAGLGSEAGMNVPGRAAGNWAWRARPEHFSGASAARLRRLVALTGRLRGRDLPS